MSFSSLGLSEKVLAAVEAAGYTEPTAIQAAAIPHVLQKRDVLGLAQTGTGKTASFTLPMLTLLEKGRARARMPRTLILEPTRELAAQVEENFNKYGINHKLNVALLIGGTSFGDQDKKLDRGVDVLIATPGRLIDHFQRGRVMLMGVEILVIDEADRMLDMGFIPDIERICKLIPFTRQTLFFSATMPPEIQRLVDTFLHNPARVEVARASSTAETVTQNIVASGSKDFDKRATLRRMIDQAENLTNAIIFCNRKRDIGTLQKFLTQHGLSAVALHGDMTQPARTETLARFKNNEVSLLVCSDVAARGLDVQAVSHVFNFDVPSNAEDYVHRIGRTGRAGMTGRAYTIATPEDAKYVAAIEQLIGTSIPRIAPDDVASEALDTSDAGGKRRRGGRKGKAEATEAPARAEAAPAAEAPAPKAVAPKAPAEAKPEAEADEGKPPRTRRARSERTRNPERIPEREKAPAAKHEPIRDRRDEPKRERKPRVNDEDAAETGTGGFGDDVPAFLLRTVKMKKSA
jgi:superfamily II DNA/RNA helicase